MCSDPDSHAVTDYFAVELCGCFETSGFVFSDFTVLDGRNHMNAAKIVRNANLVILAGGHVPTQNSFFGAIGLREILNDYNGVLVGISAGSMNSAETVYVHPERDGEAIDPAFERFRPGLGLTRMMILPHYQLIREDILDGLRVFEDIAYPDSMVREFYALCDGSWLLIENGTETLFGEAYRISEGNIERILNDGEWKTFD